MRVTVHQNACREYANCVIESPDVFDIDDTAGKARVLLPDPGPELEAEVRAAAAACPMHAISVED
jgi:ferredoxin